MTGGAAASQAYGEAWYWDERYRKEAGPFDWYQKYPALAPLLRLYLAPHHRLLLVGCGNSVFGENMVDDGYQDVVNIDISSVVIEQMKKKYHDKPQLKYMKMDVKDMSYFESGSFDAVIDKVWPKFTRECNENARGGQQNPQGKGCLHADHLWGSKLPIASPEGHGKLDNKAPCHRKMGEKSESE